MYCLLFVLSILNNCSNIQEQHSAVKNLGQKHDQFNNSDPPVESGSTAAVGNYGSHLCGASVGRLQCEVHKWISILKQ